MAPPRPRLFAPLPVLLLLAGTLGATLPGAAEAGPVVRRAQERKACQEFATKLQQAGANPAMAQQVYQQGVLQLVARFGENPCSDIPAPAAAPASATPPGTPANAPAAAPPATAAPAATTPAATPAAAAPAASAQQQQACQQFATKVQASASSGGAAAAQQTYSMGLQKLTGMFGANPCPSVRPPQ